MVEPEAPRVARYRLRRPLGAGGLGVVYAALDPELGREVAIKLIRLRSTKSRGFDRLRREATALARVSDPHVVGVFDVGRYDVRRQDMARTAGWPTDVPRVGIYIVMELVSGMELRRWLETPREHDAVVRTFRDAGRGLAAAHAAGVVHRDFKPANVLVDDDGRVKVIDFGLAQWLHVDPTSSDVDDESPRDVLRSSSVTMTGTIMGTPVYMAPEQHRGDPVDARSDQYGFCIAFVEALCGERPFPGSTVAELSEAKHQQRLTPRVANIPPGLRRVLERGLALDPAARWPSMTALLEQLDGSRARTLWMLVGGGVAALGLVGWALPTSPSDSRALPPATDASAPSSAANLDLRPSPEAETLRRDAEALWIARRPLSDLRGLLDSRAPRLEAIDDPSLRAEVLLWRGRLLDGERAAELFRRAYFLARESDVPSTAARAAIAMTTVVVGDHGQALAEWTRHAWIEVERGAWDRDAAIDVAVTSAAGRSFAFTDEQTKAALEFAGSTIGEIGPNDGVLVASKMLELSSAWRYQDEPELALHWARTGGDLADAIVEPDHVLHTLAEEHLGLALESLERCDEALPHLEQALAGYIRINDGALDVDGALLGFSIADCLEIMDRPEVALAEYERILTFFEAHHEAYGSRRTYAHLGAARLLAQLGRDREAESHYEDAIAVVDLADPNEATRDKARRELAELRAKRPSKD